MNADEAKQLYGELCNLMAAATGHMEKAMQAVVKMRKLMNGGIMTREEKMKAMKFKEDFPTEEE